MATQKGGALAARPLAVGALVMVKGGPAKGLVFRIAAMRPDGAAERGAAADGMPQVFEPEQLIVAITDEPLFRVFDAGYTEHRGKLYRLTICEQLAGGRWEGFCSLEAVRAAGGAVN